MIRIQIPGKPVPWSAPRYTKNNIYSAHRNKLMQTKFIVKAQYQDLPILSPIKVKLFFYFVPSKSLQNRDIFHVKKPDVDNCCKFILDAIKNIVIKDDNQIYELFAKKVFFIEAKTIIEILPENPIIKKVVNAR